MKKGQFNSFKMSGMSLYGLILLCCMSVMVSSWSDHEDIRTGRVIMYSGSNFTASDVPISYNISYSSALTNTSHAAGIGINGYQTYITNDFSPNTTIQNFTNSWLRITFKTYGDTQISYFAVDWIAIGTNALSFVEVLFDCFLCSTLNTGNGSRTETQTGTTFFSGESLQVTIHLAGFQIHNSQGITNYLNAAVSVPTGSSTLTYTFNTQQNNTISSICYTTIIFCQACTEDYWKNWGKLGQQLLSNSTTPTVFGPQNRYQSQNRMFFGISSLNTSRAHNRYFSMDTTQYNSLDTGYGSNFGTYSIMVDYFWIAVSGCNSSHPWFVVNDQSCVQNNNCPNNTYQTNPGSFCHGCDYTCQTCDGAHPQNCTACDSTKFRYLNSSQCFCQSGYIDINIQLCYPCQYYISGCDTCVSTSVCTTCFPGFILLSNGICGCTSGHLVTGVCTNITGCTSAIQHGGTVSCLACNSTLNFQVSTSATCQCTTGYTLSTVQNCDPICGDGRKVTQQGCDDNNTIDGDGCSSGCVVETNWACFNGSTTTQSVCLIDNTFSVSVMYVYRLTNENTMQVGLKITPEYSEFTTMNFKKNLTHNIPASTYNATYENGILVLQFNYTQTIQSNTYTVNFLLDSDQFYNSSLSVAIPASGMNAKLTYDSSYGNNYPLEIAIIVLDVLAILVMLSSMASQKMIGVQLIQTFQSVLFGMAVLKTVPSTLSPLQKLQYSNGFNDVHGTDATRTYTFAFSLSSIGLEKEFLLSFNLMFIILLCVIGFCIVTKVIQLFYLNKIKDARLSFDDTKKYEGKAHTITLVFNFAFEKLFYLIGMMTYFLVVFALMLQLTDMQASYQVLSKELNLFGTGIAIAIMITLVTTIIVNGIYPQTRLYPMIMKKAYAPIYVIYQTTFIFVLAFNYTQQYVLYILLGLSFLFMVFTIAYQPYPQKIHTFVLVFHQITIMVALGAYLFQTLTTTQNQTFFTVIIFVLLVLLLICVFLNLYRIYRYYKYCEDNKIDLYNYAQIPNENAKLGDEVTNSLLGNNLYQKQKSPLPNESQMQEIKKSKKSKKTNPDLVWNYNELAEPETKTRVKATERQPTPDTQRQRKEDYYYKNAYNEDQKKEEFLTPKEKHEEELSEPKFSKTAEEDPLKLIRMKLKKDFDNKIKSSTLKQSAI